MSPRSPGLLGTVLLLAAVALPVVSCGERPGGASSARPRIGYVTNGVASFWVIAKAGAEAGGRDFDAEVSVEMPSEGISHQKRILEDMLTRGFDGIAVSPIDPANQTDLLNRVAQHTLLITQDSDAPGANRLCYVGMDNYVAGRMCGELVRECLPEGGKVAILVGRLEQDNARRRRQGVIDAVLGRDPDPERFDPPDAVLRAGRYEIVATLTDQFDRAQGKANAEDLISRYPDLACMVGLFAYNPPLILEALTQAGKLGEVRVVAFDEAEETLRGIREGTVYGTVVQDPYRYGYESVRILAALARGDRSVLPSGGFLNIPARKIRRAEVDAFEAELKKNLGR